MKKTVALLFAAALFFFVAGCGQSGPPVEESTPAYGETGEPENAKEIDLTDSEKEERYQAALQELDKAEDYAAAYALFEEIGNYKNTAEYLSRFTVVEDVLLATTTRSYSTNFDDGWSRKSTFHYSPEGYLIQVDDPAGFEDAFEWEAGSLLGSKIEYVYSETGRLEKAYYYLWTELMCIFSYSYDEKDLLVNVLIEDLFAETERSFDFTYNEKGLLESVVYPDDLFIGSENLLLFEYDRAGKLIHETRLHDGRMWYVWSYKYNKEGRLTEKSHRNPWTHKMK